MFKNRTFTTGIVVIVSILILVIIRSNPGITPNSRKFEYNEQLYGSRIWGPPVGEGRYYIDDMRYLKALAIRHPESDRIELILDGVHEYEFENKNLYCFAEDGFAVVYAESNVCKVLITPPESLLYDFGKRYEENNYCIDRISPDEYPENKLVIYLDTFDEFTAYEQKMLNKLKKEYQEFEVVNGVINKLLGFDD